MRVNLYCEELTDRIEVIEKEPEGHKFYGCRFYLELPVTKEANGGVTVYRGPFKHHKGDDDSAAVTFWHNDKAELAKLLRKAANILDPREID